MVEVKQNVKKKII